MRTFGTVLPDELAIRAEPGGDKVIGHLDQNVRVELADFAIEHPKATWWKLAGKPGYVAERNKSGQTFLKIEYVAEPLSPEKPFKLPSWVGVALIVAVVVVIAFLIVGPPPPWGNWR